MVAEARVETALARPADQALGRARVPRLPTTTDHLKRFGKLDRATRRIWPIIRLLVGGKLARRCAQCVLPETATVFDDEGVCQPCRDHGSATASEPEDISACAAEIDALLSRRSAADHDAIVALSGGKDSLYLLHRLRTRFPDLRILTALADNGLLSPVAHENVSAAVRAYDVDHVTLRLKPSFVASVFRACYDNLSPPDERYPIYGVLHGNMAFDAIKMEAAARGIPLVIGGISRVQVATMWGEAKRCVRIPYEGASRGGLALVDLAPESEQYHWCLDEAPDDDAMPRYIAPLAAWDVSENEVMEAFGEIDFVDPGQLPTVVTSDAYGFAFMLAEYQKFGYSSVDVQWSLRVREGTVDRGYWLNVLQMMEYSAKTGKFISKSLLESLPKMGLTPSDIGLK